MMVWDPSVIKIEKFINAYQSKGTFNSNKAKIQEKFIAFELVICGQVSMTTA